ncbi:MAG: hypothetical protein HYV02_01190 [Deltaproteobacteria bacterium]|nr:hypothetical protein [Deltaproteobacteria bacterium]
MSTGRTVLAGGHAPRIVPPQALRLWHGPVRRLGARAPHGPTSEEGLIDRASQALAQWAARADTTKQHRVHHGRLLFRALSATVHRRAADVPAGRIADAVLHVVPQTQTRQLRHLRMMVLAFLQKLAVTEFPDQLAAALREAAQREGHIFDAQLAAEGVRFVMAALERAGHAQVGPAGPVTSHWQGPIEAFVEQWVAARASTACNRVTALGQLLFGPSVKRTQRDARDIMAIFSYAFGSGGLQAIGVLLERLRAFHVVTALRWVIDRHLNHQGLIDIPKGEHQHRKVLIPQILSAWRAAITAERTKQWQDTPEGTERISHAPLSGTSPECLQMLEGVLRSVLNDSTFSLEISFDRIDHPSIRTAQSPSPFTTARPAGSEDEHRSLRPSRVAQLSDWLRSVHATSTDVAAFEKRMEGDPSLPSGVPVVIDWLVLYAMWQRYLRSQTIGMEYRMAMLRGWAASDFATASLLFVETNPLATIPEYIPHGRRLRWEQELFQSACDALGVTADGRSHLPGNGTAARGIASLQQLETLRAHGAAKLEQDIGRRITTWRPGTDEEAWMVLRVVISQDAVDNQQMRRLLSFLPLPIQSTTLRHVASRVLQGGIDSVEAVCRAFASAASREGIAA